MIHVSPQHRIVGVPATPQITNLWPSARVITFGGNPTALLPHGFAETKMLRELGLDVPAPILSQYDWAGGTPYEVQRKTAAMLTISQRAYVLNGMGTGKTKSALWAWDFLNKNFMAKRALVIAPLSTLNFVWGREVFDTLPTRSYGVLHGSKAKRIERLKEDHDIYIINTDGLSVMIDELIDAVKSGRIDTLIIDELAAFRNGSAQRSKLCKKLAALMVWVWGLTGSPTPKEPTDAWGQCRIVTPHTVPQYFTRFRDEVMTRITQFKYLPKPNANERVFQVMQPAVRFTLDDVVELPPVVMRTVDLDLGKRQAEVYETLRKHALVIAQGKEVTAVNAGAMLNKLLQVSQGYVYTTNHDIVALDNEIRIDALVDAINSTDQKVIVFAPFRHALTGIMEALEKEGISAERVDGSVSQGKRSEIFNRFQNNPLDCKVLVAHPVSMSHGLTLTAAATVIWFGPTTSLETFEQANARVRRIGQKHKQLVLMFQSTAAERKIYAKLQQRQDVQDDLLSMFADAQN